MDKKRCVITYTLKGVGGDILICEEAAYMDLGVFYEVIVPLLEVEKTCIIFITTPLGSFNFHSAFSELKDAKGRKVFNTIKVGLICKACMLSEHPERCPHMKGRRPAWKSESKFQNIISVLMKDQVTLLQREALGTVADDDNMAFDKQRVQQLFESTPSVEEEEHMKSIIPPVLFMAVDPTGEGSSKFAVFTAYYDGNRQYVLGMEAHVAPDRIQQKKLLLQHIKSIRNCSRFRNSIIIFVPEANLGLEHQHLASYMKNLQNVYIFRGSSNTPGVKTLPATKPLFVDRADDYLMNDAIRFDPDFICSNPFAVEKDAASRTHAIKELWKKQLFMFKRYIIAPRTVNGRGYVRYSGKADPTGAIIQNGEDDLVMAWAINSWVASAVYKKRTSVPIDQFLRGARCVAVY